MDRQYWERVAKKHEDQIFDVFDNDNQGSIVSAIKRFSNRQHRAADIGCAIGKWLPVLSTHFKKVFAVDIAENYLDQAIVNNRDFGNIEYLLGDVGKMKPLACEFLLCVNALLTPDESSRNYFLESIAQSVIEGGHVLLVVPSMESALFSEFIFRYWHRNDGTNAPEVPAIHSPEILREIKDGIVRLDSVPTKHFLEEELRFILPSYNLEIKEIKKVEYSWSTELENPPDWLQDPRPWDWMVVAEKKSAKDDKS